MQLCGHELERRRLALDDDRHQLVRRLGAPLAIEAQHVWRLLDRPEDRSRQDDRAHGVQAKLELRDDPEVPPPPRKPQKSIGVLGLACRDELAHQP